MFDNTDAVSLELLRFRPELAVSNGFESALRGRVEQLSRLRHPAFAPVRAVVHLDGQALTLVSAHIQGQRLSEQPIGNLRKGLHPAVVTWIIREITPALAALQSSGPHVAHGALSADRLVMTQDGSLRIAEHTLGWAIRRLALTPAVFWREFGLVAPVDERGIVKIDPRTDLMQLGTVALSLLLARPISLTDFQRGLPALLNEFSAMAASSPSAFAAPLRVWLERALQLAPRPYRSAAEAQEALHELPVPPGPGSALRHPGVPLPAALGSADDGDRVLTVSRMDVRGPLRPAAGRELPASPVLPVAADRTPESLAPLPSAKPSGWRRASTAWVAIGLAAIAIGEGVIIARVGTQPAIVSVAPPAAAGESRRPAVTRAVERAALVLPREAARTPAPDPAIAALAAAASRQRSGGVRWNSPIDLNVLEGDRVLGSTADGPVVMSAGTHQVELVNASLGYRTRQTVTVRAGVITPLNLVTPYGRMNINAQPWAQVMIDDSPIGETPLANVSVPLGQHQITFRHPQLGERRMTVAVRGDAVARVTMTFDR
jgi:hypothetical protein